MPRQHVVTWDDQVSKTLSITCGYCRTDVEAVRVSPAVEVGRVEMPGIRTHVRVSAAYRCPRTKCGHLSIVFVEFADSIDGVWGHEVVGQLPRGKAAPMEGLPGAIQADRDEAWSCFYGGDFRAAVIMGRAAIQRAVRGLEASGGSLKEELDDLLAKGVITRPLHDWGDEVRIAGNDAAHPEDLGKIEREEAEESLKFMDAFLDYAIALPAKRDARKAGRDQS